jgi:hypothetical protein
MTIIEKICRGESSPIVRKMKKKAATRKIRRAAKKDPENAVTKIREVTRGWTS